MLDRNEAGVGEAVSGIRQKGGTAFGRVVDVSSPQEVQEAFDWIATDVGDIYALVNSAGILSISPALELSYSRTGSGCSTSI